MSTTINRLSGTQCATQPAGSRRLPTPAPSPNQRPSAPRTRQSQPIRGRRAAFEFYPTPPEAIRALLSVEKFDGPIWEPACGNGAISKELEAAGYSVVSTDLIDRGYGRGNIDFLKTREPLAKHIVTNPPYGRHGLGDAFVRKALIHAQRTGGTVAMLLNLRSLCNPDRHVKFCKTPPAAIYALDEIVCWPNGIRGRWSDRIARQQYYWAVWKPDHTARSTEVGTGSAPGTGDLENRAPKFWWLSAKAFRGRQ